MITSQGMLVCSFNLKQRFSRGEENVYSSITKYKIVIIVSYLKFVIEDLKEIHKQK